MTLYAFRTIGPSWRKEIEKCDVCREWHTRSFGLCKTEPDRHECGQFDWEAGDCLYLDSVDDARLIFGKVVDSIAPGELAEIYVHTEILNHWEYR